MMFVVTLPLILIFGLQVLCFSGDTFSNGILNLDEDITSAVNENEYIFINFYASWCKHSIAAAPQFQKAAKIAWNLELPVIFAEIESTGKKEMFDLTVFPTYKLYRRGIPIQYAGNRTADDFIEWIQRHLESVKELTTPEEAHELIASENLVLVGFFRNESSKAATTFRRMADYFDNPTFAITSNEEILEAYNVDYQEVMLFKEFGEEITVLPVRSLNLEVLKKFIQAESLPVVEELTENTFKTLPLLTKYALVVVSKNDSRKTNQVLNAVNVLAKLYKNKIKFLILDVDKTYMSEIIKVFHIAPSEVPSIILVPNIFQTSNYKLYGNLSLSNMEFYFTYFNTNTLDQWITDKMPDEWDQGPVYKLTEVNFLNVTHDLTKDVLVYFHTTNCEECVIWASVVELLGKKFADHEDVLVTKINVGLNSVEFKWYRTIPSIALFKKGTNKHILYTGGADFQEIVNFVELAGRIPRRKRQK